MKSIIRKLILKKLCLIMIPACVFVYVVLLLSSDKSPSARVLEYIYKADSDVTTTNNRANDRLILLWTTYFYYADFKFGLGRQGFIKHKCPVYNCTLTNDRSLLGQSDAVVFHVRNFRASDVPDPKLRKWNQYWIYLSRESPDYSLTDLRSLNGFFNWTMTYRSDSDIFMPYGKTVPKENVNAITSRNQTHIMRQFVGWMVGDCETHSQREKYVKELTKYARVDKFGRCNQRLCYGSCETGFYRRYKFYLSFENSLCKDYVTEKFFKIFNYMMVPVVYGLGNYSSLAPPHSYIDVRDFDTPEALGRYLSVLDANQTAFNEYFKWKSHYKVVNIGHPDFCDLCRRLHENNPPKVYQNIHNWWNNGAEDSEQSICTTEIKPFETENSNFVN